MKSKTSHSLQRRSSYIRKGGKWDTKSILSYFQAVSRPDILDDRRETQLNYMKDFHYDNEGEHHISSELLDKLYDYWEGPI